MMAAQKGRLVGGGGCLLEDRPMSRDDAAGPGFEKFEQFLKEWSRRDFLKRTGGAAAYMAFMAGGLQFLEARSEERRVGKEGSSGWGVSEVSSDEGDLL